MRWFEDPFYDNEKRSVVDAIVSFAKMDQPIVEETYNVPFSNQEAFEILGHYLNYAGPRRLAWQSANEGSWLSDPFFRYIVVTMTGSAVYDYTKKGLRDRVWVYLAGLVSIAKENTVFNKWHKPYIFKGLPAPAPKPDPLDPIEPKRTEPKRTEPGPVIPDRQKEAAQNRSILVALGLFGVGLATKFLKLW